MDNNANNTKQDKLITVAIHTFSKAQILKTVLESERIPVVLQNVNQLLPQVSAGVRLRIHEDDLAKALSVIEDTDWQHREITDSLNSIDSYKDGQPIGSVPYVLVPVDFSSVTSHIVELAFRFAANRHLEVVIINAYSSDTFSGAPILMDKEEDSSEEGTIKIHRDLEHCTCKMDQLNKEIREKIRSQKIPNIAFSTHLRNGSPEKVILSIAKKTPPIAIIMGTRGKSVHTTDLIGSVAAEVIDSAKVPLFIIPDKNPLNDLEHLETVAVSTLFDQRDFVLFDRMINLMHPNTPSYKIFNMSDSAKELTELELRAMLEYYKEHYPKEGIEFRQISADDFEEGVKLFIANENIDLIVVNTYHRNLFARFFNPSVARHLLFLIERPLLIMHSNSSR